MLLIGKNVSPHGLLYHIDNVDNGQNYMNIQIFFTLINKTIKYVMT